MVTPLPTEHKVRIMDWVPYGPISSLTFLIPFTIGTLIITIINVFINIYLYGYTSHQQCSIEVCNKQAGYQK